MEKINESESLNDKKDNLEKIINNVDVDYLKNKFSSIWNKCKEKISDYKKFSLVTATFIMSLGVIEKTNAQEGLNNLQKIDSVGIEKIVQNSYDSLLNKQKDSTYSLYEYSSINNINDGKQEKPESQLKISGPSLNIKDNQDTLSFEKVDVKNFSIQGIQQKTEEGKTNFIQSFKYATSLKIMKDFNVNSINKLGDKKATGFGKTKNEALVDVLSTISSLKRSIITSESATDHQNTQTGKDVKSSSSFSELGINESNNSFNNIKVVLKENSDKNIGGFVAEVFYN